MSNQELIEYLTDNSGEYNKRINRKYLETHDLNILHILNNSLIIYITFILYTTYI